MNFSLFSDLGTLGIMQMNFVEFPEFQWKCLVPIFLLLFLVRVHIFFTGQKLLCRGGRDPCGPPLLFLHFPPLIFVFFFFRLHRFVTDDSFPPSNLLTAPCFSFSSSGFFSSAGKGGLAAIYRVRR